ncbi:fimbrial biogenesis chaperone [Pseudomonas protegens]|uniref:fimbrial biogenesis chaperone n=1 Tax=Pseudomonas protegens TaxID=380021 RepID=UPI00384BB738
MPLLLTSGANLMNAISRYLLLGFALLGSSLACAGITLDGTRVIYPEKSKEVSILIRNTGSQDIMIQSWLESNELHNEQNIPFALTPSLSRLAGNNQQMLRIFYYGKGLPTDKESIFWLNVQEIPQKSAEQNTLQIAVRQRIKMFYRPKNLTENSQEAVGNLKWKMLRENGKSYLQVSNGSPYHISFSSGVLSVGEKKYPVELDMVTPGSVSKFAVTGEPTAQPSQRALVEFHSINDYGTPIKGTATVSY